MKEREWFKLLNPVVVGAFVVHIVIVLLLFVTALFAWGPMGPLVALAVISIAWLVVSKRYIEELVEKEARRVAPPPPPREPGGPFRRPPSLSPAPIPSETVE